MTAAAKTDPRLYGKAGLSSLNPKAPLEIIEKAHPHRCISDETECYDCGQYIGRGKPMIVSGISATQGMKGKSHRYEIHPECYSVVERVVIAMGKDAVHSFEGRPKVLDLWRLHHVELRRRDKDLADTLEGVFGKP